MLRNNLLENKYNFERKMPNKWLISALWIFLCLIFLSLSFGVFMLAVKLDSPERVHLVDYGLLPYIIIFSVVAFIYFGLKIRMTSLFCHNKKHNMTVRVNDEDGFPVLACKEALKTWQIILIHSIPAVLAYFILSIIIMLVAFDVFCVILLFIGAFVVAYDLSLVICVLCMKARYKPEYIALNHHLYDMTLYTKQ